MIVDSDMSFEDALRQNPESPCPLDILAIQRVLTVHYYGFDGMLHKGRMVVHGNVVQEVIELFDLIRQSKFPMTSVIPICDPRFAWSDEASASADNSSGFNYRAVTGGTELSKHALGRAIDLNPRRNPYIKGELVLPQNAVYDAAAPGTLSAKSSIVGFMEKRRWTWGGRWTDLIDYQHFEKSY
jgi:hypothetical protein